MQRKYKIISWSAIGVIILSGFILAILVVTPKAGAPAIINNNPNAKKVSLTIYYAALNDAGKTGTKIGCDDSAVAIKTAEIETADQIKTTFDRLLADKSQYFGQSGLYNALYNSTLKYENSTVYVESVTVNLSGKFSLGGVCDIPRVKAQLEMTAASAAGVDKAYIFVNGKSLDDVLSLK